MPRPRRAPLSRKPPPLGPGDFYLGMTDRVLPSGHRLAAPARHMVLHMREDDQPFDGAFFVPMPTAEDVGGVDEEELGGVQGSGR
mmetsp:Transcript_3477/g.8974  ORF Transcript_3477/g.8974 Transcript_3477/m.8974 type:complete len:85 (-) Transcript_3477:1217-1471(-)